MYVSLRHWRDLTDGHLYSPGEVFPHDGREIPPERADELLTDRNKARMQLIAEAPEKAVQTPQKPKRKRKV